MKKMANSGKRRKVGLWVLRVLLGAAFLAAGGAKLAGVQAMVEIFDKVGIGQWFRIVTGLLEVSGGILLLIPRLTFYGAALLLTVCLGALTAHLTVLGGNPAPAIILLGLNAVTAWLTRDTWKKSLTNQDYVSTRGQ
jgi:putative oxidoreductase